MRKKHKIGFSNSNLVKTVLILMLPFAAVSRTSETYDHSPNLRGLTGHTGLRVIAHLMRMRFGLLVGRETFSSLQNTRHLDTSN